MLHLFCSGHEELTLKIVESSGEVVSGPLSPWEEWSQDNRVLRRRSNLRNGEMIFRGDILLAHLVVCLRGSSDKTGHMSRSWCRSKSDNYNMNK